MRRGFKEQTKVTSLTICLHGSRERFVEILDPPLSKIVRYYSSRLRESYVDELSNVMNDTDGTWGAMKVGFLLSTHTHHRYLCTSFKLLFNSKLKY